MKNIYIQEKYAFYLTKNSLNIMTFLCTFTFLFVLNEWTLFIFVLLIILKVFFFYKKFICLNFSNVIDKLAFIFFSVSLSHNHYDHFAFY